MGSPDYVALPRESLDSDRYLSHTPDAYRTSLGYTPHHPQSRSTTLNHVFILRLVNLSFALPSFIIFVRQGHEKYIGADIFLMLIMIFNTVRMLHLFISSVFHITVEITRGSWQTRFSVRPNGTRATNVMDCLLASGLGIAMIGGMVRNWRNNSVVDGIVLAFFTMCFQYIIALPIKNQSFTLKFSCHKESRENEDGQIRLSNEIHRLPLGNEAHGQTSEDLV